MPIYKEKPGKLNFSIVENTHPVKITLTNEYGTVSSISYGWPSKNLNNDHLSDEVGDYQLLKNNTVIFSGESNNPSGSNNTLKITVNQMDNAQVLTYHFPDDYTGEESYTNTAGNISFEFRLKF